MTDRNIDERPDARPDDANENAALDRRGFLVWAACASIGASAFFVLATLADALLPPSRSIDGLTEVGPMAVVRLSDLTLGQPIVADYGDDKVFVVKTSATTARAFDVACPHARCTLKFSAAADRFVCPCHASSFTLEGEKIEGPSPRNLVEASVEIVNGDVIVSGFES